MACLDEKCRIVALLDMDHFEIQVRGKQAGVSPEVLRTRPVVAEGDYITSVNQAAKDIGIKRGPSLHHQNYDRRFSPLVLTAPRKYGKAEKLSLRKAGDDVYDLIVSTIASRSYSYCFKCHKEYEPIVEKVNADEYYIDLTHEVNYRLDEYHPINLGNFSQMHAEGRRNFKIDLPIGVFDTMDHTKYSMMYYTAYAEVQNDAQLYGLLHGADIVKEVLDTVQEKLGYTISAGVGQNKLLAKLACHRSKPNGLAVLPTSAFRRIQHEMPFTKIPGLGGETGLEIEQKFKIDTIKEFRDAYYDKGLWEWLDSSKRDEIYKLCNGVDKSPVVQKFLLPKITCGKSLNTNNRNKATTNKEFIYHLENRFREMRDSLLYEYDRRGRFPFYLKLEIFTHKQPRGKGRELVFSDKVSFYKSNMENLKRWRLHRPHKDDLTEWAPILNIFEKKINKDASIPLFRKDGLHVAELCRIDFVAYF